jgi:hypothetical protein
MELQINKLINCEVKILKDLGWLLYHRKDQQGGLSLDEVHSLLKLITVEATEKIYNNGFSDGISEALEH